MKLLFDLLPIVLFFIAYKLFDIYVATATAIVSCGALLVYTLLRGKRPDIMQIITFVMVLVLGGMTLLLHNEMFIKWKPSVVYWILGSVFFGAPFVSGKNLVELMLSPSISLSPQSWTHLNRSWYAFFFIMGFLNLFVVYNFSTEAWVNFKLFGTLILTLVFVIIQGIIISRAMPKKDAISKRT